MIIELSGPPGAGKTTFCHLLARRLRDQGSDVELWLSRRPAELPEAGAATPPPLAVLRRLTRPLVEMRAIFSSSAASKIALARSAALIALLPQDSAVRSLRARQYLIRLSLAWQKAAMSPGVTIFDQGFVQAVWTLACAARTVCTDVFENALRLIPRADLVVHVDAPFQVTEARLRNRLSEQGPIERWLERATRRTLENEVHLQELLEVLQISGRHVVKVEATDMRGMSGALDAIIDAVGQRVTRASVTDAKAPRAESKKGAGSNKLSFTATLFFALMFPFHLTGAPPSPASGPLTPWHYAAGGNFAGGRFTPGASGFNLADVSEPSQVPGLPSGTKALVWIGTCAGADAVFAARVESFRKSSDVFGFYLMDDPDPTGRWHVRCLPEKLREEADFIHAHAPGAAAFVALMNLGSSQAPTFQDDYAPSKTHVDLFGIAPYPCRQSSTCDIGMIDRFVAAAERSAIGRDQIVPIYQAFGGGDWHTDEGGSYAMPTSREMTDILRRWAFLVPKPAFDYAYSWGSQRGDVSLEGSKPLRDLFGARNLALRAPPRTPSQIRADDGVGELDGASVRHREE